MSEASKKLSWLESELGIKSLAARVGIRFGAALLCALFILLAFRITFCNWVDNYEWAYQFDSRTGEITILDKTGYIVTWPIIVDVHTIDMRPFQVTINANNRVLNAKLVQFQKSKEGLLLFVSWHGRKDYGTADVHIGGFVDIMKSYAYDGAGRSYPFLRIVSELKPGEEKVLEAGAAKQ